MTVPLDRRPLVAAGVLLGVGLGGFVDGIVLHQLLQVHGMLTAKYPRTGVDAETALVNAEINMFWDVLFLASGGGLLLLGSVLVRLGRADAGPRPPG